MPDDAVLLRDYVENHSESAFAELVQRHIDLVYSAALRRIGGDAHQAQDVTQQVFTTLARKAAQLREHPSLAGWLHACTRFAAVDWVRKEQRRRNREQVAMAQEADGFADDTPPDWEQLRPIIDEALDALDGRDRDAILMRYFAGLGWAEVGARLRLSEDAARKRVSHALERLRKQLGRQGVTSSAAALALGLAHVPAAAAPAGLAATVSAGALAAAGTAGTAAATATFFMSTAKFTTGMGGWAMATASVIGTATLGFVSWNENQELAALRSQTAAVLRQAEGQEVRLRRQIAAVHAAREVLRQAPPERGVVKSSSTSAASDAATLARERAVALNEALAAHPEYQELTRRSYRLLMLKEYGPFFASHSLPPQTAEALKELLVDKRDLSLRASQELRKSGPPPGAKLSMLSDTGGYAVTVRPEPDSPRMVLENKIKSLLGRELYAELVAHERLMMYARPAEQIALDLRDRNVPATPEQQRALQQLLHDTRIYPGAPVPGLSLETTPTPDEAALTARAAAILNPQQVQLLAEHLVDKRRAMAVRQQLTSAVITSSPTPSTGR